MSDISRKQHPKIDRYLCNALANDAGALITASGTLKPEYVATPIAMKALENDPNTTAPATSRMIFAGDIDPQKTVTSVTLWPEYTGTAGAVSLAVWVKSGLALATGNAWIRVKVVDFDGTVADVEQVVNVGNRTAFIQAVSGVNTTNVDLYYAVA